MSMVDYQRAELELLDFYSKNDWFIHHFWPENRPRVKTVLSDSLRLAPPTDIARCKKVLDVGCHNGFMSFMFGKLGYVVTACDALDIDDRRQLLANVDSDFVLVNLNGYLPLEGIESDAYDVVFMGEIFEHILNHPVGLLEEVKRVLRPGGMLFLTTPNPSNLMNAVRLLKGGSFMRGTKEFADTIKFDQRITADPRIHYREYAPSELHDLVIDTGFKIVEHSFLPIGGSKSQSIPRRLLKHYGTPVLSARLLASTQYIVAEC